MYRTVVFDVVGLTPRLLSFAPVLSGLAAKVAVRPIRTITPALTCSVQSTFLTGLLPRDHGAVANGWYFRDLSEVWFWRQSNRLIAGEKLWETARRLDPNFTCAVLFWWYNMYSSADITVTPRPIYPADGRKIPDIYTQPPALRGDLTKRFGAFPLFHFWGPKADLRSSAWILNAARRVYDTYRPSLMLVYLPHLDYPLQRLGPDHPEIPQEVRRIDALCGEFLGYVQREGSRVVVVSEYGISPVSGPIHINRLLRDAGLIRIRDELGRDLLDPGASDAFAVADHQVAHVYIRRPDLISTVKRLLEEAPGIESVLDEEGKRSHGVDHPRSGELVAISSPERWFTYYYWMDDERAPDFARTVDIHRKPGYDPAELFIDPRLRLPRLKVAAYLLKRALGFRALLSLTPLDATLVKGCHGRVSEDPTSGPLILSSEPALLGPDEVEATAVKEIVLEHLFGAEALTSPLRSAGGRASR